MKRYLLVFFSLLVIFNLYLIAQEQEEDEILPPKRSKSGKLGGAGGFTPTFLFLDNIDVINQFISSANGAKLDNGPLALYGGQGYGYIMLVENLRVGGLGLSGTRKSKALDPNTFTRRDIEYTVGYGGVTIEYAFPIVPRLDISAGVMLGAGGVDVKMTKNTYDTKVWNDVWSEYGSPSPTSEYTRKLSGTFFVYQPSLNVEYAILRWVGLRVGVSYVGMSGGSWKMDDNYDVSGVPSDMNGNGFMINTGLFVGTFIF